MAGHATVPLFSWLQDSIEGFIQGLLTYTQESISLLNTFDVAPALSNVPSLAGGGVSVRVRVVGIVGWGVATCMCITLG